jgi:phosphoadenosine phosphosulfate reductase
MNALSHAISPSPRASELAAADRADRLLRQAITQDFPGQIALVSSFGADAAVLLHLVANIDPATPVIFINTGKLFGETLRYRDQLAARLGLTDVRVIGPTALDENATDPDGILWASDPDRCCHIRKVLPLQRVLGSFSAWINGRKRFQAASRDTLTAVEIADGKTKFNPLFDWSASDIDAYFDRHDLPRHPLVEDGYLSIGCMPCSDRVAPGEDARAGRWRGQAKVECGIHLGGQSQIRDE